MKRVLSIILALIMLCLGASAEGLLPMIGNVYGEDMPSMRRILLRNPDTTETIENGGIVVTFNQVTEDEFNRFSVYLQQFGCELAAYSLEGTQMNATVQKNGHTFSLSYDYNDGKTVLNYPSDTREEKVDIVAECDAKYAVGKYVTFGTYPQTSTGNDNTPIEWLVLARDGQKALLISRYALDCQQYNDKDQDITWQKCSLRIWLNGPFMNRAFTNGERKSILTTNVDNSKGQMSDSYSTDGGKNTRDKVFLLSYKEAYKYFNDESARLCVATEYTIKQGAWALENTTENGKAFCGWLLRSPGRNQNSCTIMTELGWAMSCATTANGPAIRPAIWVDIHASVTGNETYPEYAEGQYVKFGHYPQTKAGNDNTSIEWLVLARDGQKALLISRYALDSQPYYTSRVDITWEKCTLRTWLNGTFLNKAFTSNEQKGILTTNVDNSNSQGNSEYNTKGGSNTQDEVFLLSYTEAYLYFKDDHARMCVPTDYAIKQGAWTSSNYKVGGKATCCWRLRSPGTTQRNTIYVIDNGSFSNSVVEHSNVAVRPALWVNLESGIF